MQKQGSRNERTASQPKEKRQTNRPTLSVVEVLEEKMKTMEQQAKDTARKLREKESEADQIAQEVVRLNGVVQHEQAEIERLKGEARPTNRVNVLLGMVWHRMKNASKPNVMQAEIGAQLWNEVKEYIESI